MGKDPDIQSYCLQARLVTTLLVSARPPPPTPWAGGVASRQRKWPALLTNQENELWSFIVQRTS